MNYKGRRLLRNSIKRVFHIKDFSLTKSKLRKSFESFVYRQKYNSEDLVNVMVDLGLKNGSTVCIHSASRQLFNFNDSLESFIDGILDVIGKEGTLIMPAIPRSEFFENDTNIFDINKEPSSSGVLTEIFRKYPGTFRSRLAQASAVALGKHAEYLTKDHELSLDPWDKDSPWYKMCELDALVFNIGMPRNYIGTFEHCVESLLKTTHPYWRQFFLWDRTTHYLDENRKLKKHSYKSTNIPRVPYEPGIFKHLSIDEMKIDKISNLEVKVFYSKACLVKMVELGRRGISLYKYPSTNKYDWT